MSFREADFVCFTWPCQLSFKLIFHLSWMQQHHSKQYFNLINVFISSQTDNLNHFVDLRDESYQKASTYSEFRTLHKLAWDKLDSTDQMKSYRSALTGPTASVKETLYSIQLSMGVILNWYFPKKPKCMPLCLSYSEMYVRLYLLLPLFCHIL